MPSRRRSSDDPRTIRRFSAVQVLEGARWPFQFQGRWSWADLQASGQFVLPVFGSADLHPEEMTNDSPESISAGHEPVEYSFTGSTRASRVPCRALAAWSDRITSEPRVPGRRTFSARALKTTREGACAPLHRLAGPPTSPLAREVISMTRRPRLSHCHSILHAAAPPIFARKSRWRMENPARASIQIQKSTDRSLTRLTHQDIETQGMTPDTIGNTRTAPANPAKFCTLPPSSRESPPFTDVGTGRASGMHFQEIPITLRP